MNYDCILLLHISLALSNSRKSSKTTSISESFDDILMDITEEPEPVPRCETPYDIHRKPEV